MKYEILNETINYEGVVLNRIKRISDGLIGGFIENEENLSQEGHCFVYDNAKVFGEAKVLDNAVVRNESIVKDYAIVSGFSEILNNAIVRKYANIGDLSIIKDNSIVEGDVSQCALISDNSYIVENSIVKGTATFLKESCSDEYDIFVSGVYNLNLQNCKDFITIEKGDSGQITVIFKDSYEDFIINIKKDNDLVEFVTLDYLLNLNNKDCKDVYDTIIEYINIQKDSK